MLKPFNDIEISKVLKKKNSIKLEQVKDLYTELDLLTSSKKFKEIKEKKLSEFQKKFKTQKIVIEELLNLNIKDLVGKEINEFINIPQINGIKIKNLTELLRQVNQSLDNHSLANKNSNVLPDQLKVIVNKDLKNKNPSDPFIDTSKVFSTTELERQIVSLTSDIKQLKGFESFKNKPVGDFWISTSIKAPFEECLTIHQVCNISIENLLKKRSFTSEKVISFINALINLKILNTEKEIAPSQNETEKPSSQLSLIQAKPVDTKPLKAWKPTFEMSSLTLQMIVNIALEQSRKGHLLHTPFAKIISGIPDIISCDEFIVAWLSSSEGDLLAEEILKESNIDFRTILDSGLNKLNQYILTELPDFYTNLNLKLYVPVISLNQTFKDYFSEDIISSFQNGVSKIILKSFKSDLLYESPSKNDSFWCMNKDVYNIIFEELYRQLPINDINLTLFLKKFFYYLDEIDNKQFISSSLVFDSKKRVWTRKEIKNNK